MVVGANDDLWKSLVCSETLVAKLMYENEMRERMCLCLMLYKKESERESDRVDLFNGVSYKGIESEFIYVVDRVA